MFIIGAFFSPLRESIYLPPEWPCKVWCTVAFLGRQDPVYQSPCMVIKKMKAMACLPQSLCMWAALCLLRLGQKGFSSIQRRERGNVQPTHRAMEVSGGGLTLSLVERKNGRGDARGGMADDEMDRIKLQAPALKAHTLDWLVNTHGTSRTEQQEDGKA